MIELIILFLFFCLSLVVIMFFFYSDKNKSNVIEKIVPAEYETIEYNGESTSPSPSSSITPSSIFIKSITISGKDVNTSQTNTAQRNIGDVPKEPAILTIIWENGTIIDDTQDIIIKLKNNDTEEERVLKTYRRFTTEFVSRAQNLSFSYDIERKFESMGNYSIQFYYKDSTGNEREFVGIPRVTFEITDFLLEIDGIEFLEMKSHPDVSLTVKYTGVEAYAWSAKNLNNEITEEIYLISRASESGFYLYKIDENNDYELVTEYILYRHNVQDLTDDYFHVYSTDTGQITDNSVCLLLKNGIFSLNYYNSEIDKKNLAITFGSRESLNYS
jgi:hypothetical protein